MLKISPAPDGHDRESTPIMKLRRSEELLAQNERYIPGGLASLNRRADPCISFSRGLGAHIWDLDGNEYIDFHFGFAPYILGHNDPDIRRAVIDSMDRELSNFGSGTSEGEGELARLFLQCITRADRVQFLNTGSEATAQAIRVARAATGRAHLIKMQGGYNGHHNSVALNLMSTPEQLGGKQVIGDEYPSVPITAGTPTEELNLVHAVEFNDLEAVDAVARRVPVASVITEPCLQNVGLVKPDPGYLEGLRELADQHGFLLIFDEIKTGFRSSLGGYQEVSGVRPDLSTFGKAFANGFPIAALAGKSEYMNLAISDDPSKRVLIAGTYNSHPVPVAAGIACLRKLMDPAVDTYNRLDQLGARLQAGQEALFQRFGIPAVVSRHGSASCVYFAEKAPRNWWEIATTHDARLDAAYRKALIARGIYHFPVPGKQGSLCLAHSEEDIDRTLSATEEVLRTLTGN